MRWRGVRTHADVSNSAAVALPGTPHRRAAHEPTECVGWWWGPWAGKPAHRFQDMDWGTNGRMGRERKAGWEGSSGRNRGADPLACEPVDGDCMWW